MKCVTCGYDDNGTGDSAHMCSTKPFRPRGCKHGQLARSCEICGLEAENAQLKAELAQAAAAGLAQHEVIDQRNAELSRLKSSTITHDEWYEQCNDITRKDALLLYALDALKLCQQYAGERNLTSLTKAAMAVINIEKELAP